MTGPASQLRESISCFILGSLILLSSSSLLKARRNGEQFPSSDRLPNSTTAPLGSSVSVTESNGQNGGPLITNTDLVTLTVSVTDASNRSVPGLDKSAFTILDERVPQEISFFSDADAPISIAIVFDLSESMNGERIARAREALRHFMDTSLDSDEYSVIAFNDQPQLLLDRTRDNGAVLEKLSTSRPYGSTALFDACYMAVERLSHATYPKRAVLLISDGEDNNSHYNLDETRQLLRESDVVVYAIGIATPIQLSGKPGARVRHVFAALTEMTGGKAFYPLDASKMDEVFEQIALELRHQYSIGYRPQNFLRDGKWHHVKVKINEPTETDHLHVRSRAGYYALRDLGAKK